MMPLTRSCNRGRAAPWRSPASRQPSSSPCGSLFICSSSCLGDIFNDIDRRPMTSEPNQSLAAGVAARVERRWATLSTGVVILLIGMAAYIGIHQATMPQARVETANPTTLHVSGEFIESNLGSAVETDGSVTVRAIGQQYSFTPQCVVVP